MASDGINLGDSVNVELKAVPPYVPFKTFLSAIEALEGGVPNQIDRSIWPSQSGAMQGQLIAAFKFFELINDSGVPSSYLHELVQNKNQTERKTVLATLLLACYPTIVLLGLEKASWKQLNDAFYAYNISGATHRKAVSFFLQAAKFAGINLSTHLLKRTRESGPRGTRRRNGSQSNRETDDVSVTPPAPPVGEFKTITLRSGGTLTLICNVRFSELAREDREFTFNLLDAMTDYDKPQPPAQPDQQMRSAPRRPARVMDRVIEDDDVPF